MGAVFGRPLSRALAAGVIVLALVLLPAFARAGQSLQVGPTHASGAAGFHKSIDTPPEPPRLMADRTIGAHVPAATASHSCQAPTRDDGPRRPIPDLSLWNPLRAPPFAP